jgi:putative tricarboxylic transport membrane protein
MLARTFPENPGQTIGPALFPTIIGALMVLIGTSLVIRGRAHSQRPISFDANMHRPRMAVNFGIVVLSLIVYALVVDALGFFMTASLLLLVLFRAFSVPIGRSFALAAGVPIFIHYVFYTVLRVPLPWGVLQRFAW